MWTPTSDDELKNKLRYDIVFWYKNWYMGDDSALYRHLELFEEHYDPRLFDEEDYGKRKEAIINFLTFLQNELDRTDIE